MSERLVAGISDERCAHGIYQVEHGFVCREKGRAHEYSTRQSGNATIVDVVGDITLYNSPEVRKVLLGLIKEKHAPRVIVNLEKVKYIDSAGVASLVEGLKVSRDREKRLRAIRLQPHNPGRARTTRLIKVFEVYDTEEQALRVARRHRTIGFGLRCVPPLFAQSRSTVPWR